MEDLLNQSSDWSGNLWGGYDWAIDRPKQAVLMTGNTEHYIPLEPTTSTMTYGWTCWLILSWMFGENPCRRYSRKKSWTPLELLVLGVGMAMKIHGWMWTEIGYSLFQERDTRAEAVYLHRRPRAFRTLFLNEGKWEEDQIISQEWIEEATTPSPANPSYGYLWWLNHPNSSRYVPEAAKKCTTPLALVETILQFSTTQYGHSYPLVRT